MARILQKRLSRQKMAAESGPPVEDPDILSILVATDCHVGYMEKDPIRGEDSFITFEEILKEAVKNNVDFILLGGDLFHDNKPSRKTLHQTLYLMRKYCMGSKPCQVEFVSDQSINFSHCKFPTVNYEDPNYNVAYPVFSVHGNHDDPTGEGSLSAIDIVSVSGLLNHFGKPASVDNIEMSPLLLKKGATQLALYGLGSVRDERLHKTFCNKKVKMLRPKENQDAWFNILVLHQNRAKHGKTNHIPEHFLDEFLDLVVWGHEHECLIDADWSTSGKPFFVTQPGSSVATSLAEGEAKPKHIGLLKIQRKNFKLEKIPLKTVRPFIMEEVILKETMVVPGSKDQLFSFLTEKVENMIIKASEDRDILPLVRLKVEYSGGFVAINPHRFGQQFVKRVANSKDILLFYRKRAPFVKGEKAERTAPEKLDLSVDQADGIKMEDVIRELLTQSDQSLQLNVLSEKRMGKALREFVDKDENDAISELVKWQLGSVQKELYNKHAKEENLKDMIDVVKSTEVGDEEEDEEIEKVLATSRSKARPRGPVDSDEDLDDEDGDEESYAARKGTGRGRGRGSRGGRGAASGTTRGRGSRARGRGRGAAAKNSRLTDSVISFTKGKSTRKEEILSSGDENDGNFSLSTVSRTSQRRFQSSKKHADSVVVESDSEDNEDPFAAPYKRARR